MQKIYLFLCLLLIFESNAQKVAVPTFESFKLLKIEPSTNDFLEQYSVQLQQQMLEQENQKKEQQLSQFKKIQDQERQLANLSKNSILAEKQYYKTAAQELEMFLNEDDQSVTKKAVFCVENAFLQESLSLDDFNRELTSIVNFLKKYTIYQGWNWQDYNTRQKVLMLLFTGMLTLPSQEIKQLTYDHDDPYGITNYQNVFVSKLLTTKKGQCHSMPLLYKILADEINVKAYLCLMPQHSYIRIMDEEEKWYNFETTCGKIVPTAWLVASGFVSSEAIKSRIYMDTLGKKAIITNAIADLLEGYIWKFGYDEFVLKWSNVALKYNPKDIRCLLWKSNYLTIRTKNLIQAANYPPKNQLSNYPVIWDNYQKMIKNYQRIDKLGHTVVPNVVYQKWLKTAQ